MGREIEIPREAIVPSETAVLRALGVPSGHDAGSRVDGVLADAMEEFRKSAEPRGTIAGVDADRFAEIYEGEGDNEVPSPLPGIFPRAEALTLFAVTVGAGISERITTLFDEGQLALGATLDAVASEGTELAGVHLDHTTLEEARASGRVGEGSEVLRYSPGYCGWNITGQRALFAELDPGRIGIGLNESCLMEPLKSISGVMVMGPAEIHVFDDDYGFCGSCRTHDCRRRITELTRGAATTRPDGDTP
jgi:hypothetical protein